MIRSTELRIGNWVNLNEDGPLVPSQIEFIGFNVNGFNGYSAHFKGRSCTLEDHLNDGIIDVTPIPLTEEWLLKFGFEKQEKGYSIGISDYGYVIEYLDWREDWTFGIEYYDPVNDDELGKVYNFNGLGLKYVHQLQNLYYLLTGEELTLNNQKI